MKGKRFYFIMIPLITAVIALLYVMNAAVFVKYKPDGHKFHEPRENAVIETVVDYPLGYNENVLIIK